MWRLTVAKARRDCSKDVAGGGGGGEDVRPPCGFRAPEARKGQNSGGSNRNPHRRHELCAETDKKAKLRAVITIELACPLILGSLHAYCLILMAVRRGEPYQVREPGERAVGTPLTIWARQKKQGPCDYQGPFQLSGALWLSGTLPTVRGL